MKYLLSFFTFFFVTQALAETSAVSVSQTSIESSSPLDAGGALRVQLGQSQFDGRSQVAGRGLTVGAAYDFTSYLGVGGSYTHFFGKRTQIDPFLTESEESFEHEILTAFAEVSPIRYRIESVELTASLEAGAAFGSYRFEIGNPVFYYGINLGAHLNKQVGFVLGTKASSAFNTINSASLIGYF